MHYLEPSHRQTTKTRRKAYPATHVERTSIGFSRKAMCYPMPRKTSVGVGERTCRRQIQIFLVARMRAALPGVFARATSRMRPSALSGLRGY